MKTVCTLFFLASMYFLGLGVSYGQGVGAGLGYANELALSARVEFNLTDDIEAAPAFSYFLGGGNPWLINLDGHYNLPVGDSFEFYPIGGLNLFGGVDGGDTDLGIDLGAGINFSIQDNLRFYLEANYLLLSADELMISAGVMLPIGN